MSALKLVIFDVDGTLVDSQGEILGAMRAAFASVGQPAPTRENVLSIVGLTLPIAIARLAPDLDATTHAAMVEIYKDSYAELRRVGGPEAAPLYPGVRALLDRLQTKDDWLLGVATGKSRRGLSALIEGHGLEGIFVTTQVADDHPSKPHPSMILTALAETGVDAKDAVMIGDTTFDMEMARNAGVRFVGVGWGYHPVDSLTGATAIAEDADALDRAITALLGDTA